MWGLARVLSRLLIRARREKLHHDYRNTSRLSVLVGLKDGTTREIWTVEHSGDRTMLRRADGSYLAAAK